MSKVAVVYWSGTGNTEEMAKAVVAGAKAAGAEVELIFVTDFNVSMVDNYSAIAFGCPATGEEELDQSDFHPMFASLKNSLADKPIALFGSYSWGEGDWMRSWEQEARSYNARLVAGSAIAADQPNDEALQACRDLGMAVAKAAV